MTVREASFADLCRIGFWVQLGPILLGVLLTGVLFSVLALRAPELPGLLAEANLLPIPAAAYAGGMGAMLGFIWAVTLAYALFLVVFAALRTFSGALIVMMWRRAFRRAAA